jgi:CDP-4-dehydro-6-deoxyglucose reductase
MPIVTMQPGGQQVPLEDGDTVLEGLYRAGYAITVGCRRGGCGICKADLRDGSVSYRKAVAESVLPESEQAAGTCLTCRAVPDTDVTIALRTGSVRRVNPFLVLASTTS